MSDAIAIFNYIFRSIGNFLFAQTLFAENVSIGHVFVMVNVFIILITNILNVPEGDNHHHNRHNPKSERRAR